MKRSIIQVLHKKKSHYRYSVGENGELLLIVLTHGNTFGNVTVTLAKRGGRAHIIGFVVGKDNENLSLHTLQLHQAPETTSNLLVKSILSDSSHFAFDGVIRVERKAQKTDAYQRNENLLLSPHAKSESKPVLEILANDVRCTHGATVGSLSKDELWYLATRGISEHAARELIVDGFFESALEKISDTIVRQRVRKQLWQILSK